MAEVFAGLETADDEAAADLIHLLTHRVPPGVDEAAQAKVAHLAALARGETASDRLSPTQAVELLGTMLGGYNVPVLVELLDSPELGAAAAESLSGTLLVFDAFHDVVEMARRGNRHADSVLRSWAAADWFTGRPDVPEALHLTVFRVDGEINTDDLSPATEAWSRADIPLHALSLLANRADIDDPIGRIAQLRSAGRPVAFVGDVVGTGSSRKSSVNSLLWHIGHDIPFVPNKRRGGVVIASKIAPIFANTLEDAGALPVEVRRGPARVPVTTSWCGPRKVASNRRTARCWPSSPIGRSRRSTGCERAGGCTWSSGGPSPSGPGRALDLGPSPQFRRPPAPPRGAQYTLAQKIVGRACGVDGVPPGVYCEPTVSSVGSQDTTGPMNRNELEELGCLGFSADLVLQTFCHTSAYPKAVDIETQRTLPAFMTNRGGVALRPGDGIIHSWLNRMLLPDQVGTGSDSHTRFPLGISFPAGSGLVAFAAAMGAMPLDMPESVQVRFSGTLNRGITLRDLVQAIPYAARQQGHLTVGTSEKEERLRRTDHRDRGPRAPHGGAGVRALRLDRRTLGLGLHDRPVRGVGGLLSPIQSGHAPLADRCRLRGCPLPRAAGVEPWSAGSPIRRCSNGTRRRPTPKSSRSTVPPSPNRWLPARTTLTTSGPCRRWPGDGSTRCSSDRA